MGPGADWCMVEPATLPAMADAPYLVALALCTVAGERALPLTGLSLPTPPAAAGPGPLGEQLALELLLQLWQRSGAGSLQRAEDPSLLLVELPLAQMSERLPLLKRDWLAGGSTAAFLAGLASLSLRGWTASIAKREPVRFSPWPATP